VYRQNGIDLSDYRLLIFDMDGTIYHQKANVFDETSLGKEVQANKRKFLEERGMETEKVMPKIRENYGNDTSIGLEEEYGIPREIYFGEVWGELKTSEHIESYPEKLPQKLQSLDPKVALLTNAPRIWAKKVLEYLGIKDQLDAAFYGNKNPKPRIEAFTEVLDEFDTHPEDAIMIGDEEIDVVPAERIGMETAIIGEAKKSRKSFKNIQAFLKEAEK